MRYRVRMTYIVTQSALVEVEADSEEEAIAMADEIAPAQCCEDDRNLETSEVEEIEDEEKN